MKKQFAPNLATFTVTVLQIFGNLCLCILKVRWPLLQSSQPFEKRFIQDLKTFAVTILHIHKQFYWPCIAGAAISFLKQPTFSQMFGFDNQTVCLKFFSFYYDRFLDMLFFILPLYGRCQGH